MQITSHIMDESSFEILSGTPPESESTEEQYLIQRLKEEIICMEGQINTLSLIRNEQNQKITQQQNENKQNLKRILQLSKAVLDLQEKYEESVTTFNKELQRYQESDLKFSKLERENKELNQKQKQTLSGMLRHEQENKILNERVRTLEDQLQKVKCGQEQKQAENSSLLEQLSRMSQGMIVKQNLQSELSENLILTESLKKKIEQTEQRLNLFSYQIESLLDTLFKDFKFEEQSKEVNQTASDKFNIRFEQLSNKLLSLNPFGKDPKKILQKQLCSKSKMSENQVQIKQLDFIKKFHQMSSKMKESNSPNNIIEQSLDQLARTNEKVIQTELQSVKKQINKPSEKKSKDTQDCKQKQQNTKKKVRKI